MTALTKDGYRSWILTHMEEQKRDHPRRSKKDRWHAANSEWLKLRPQQKRAERTAALEVSPLSLGIEGSPYVCNLKKED